MKKFKEKNIEQFFQQTNNIAPIYTEEKVHQIINKPKTKARLKGKNNNLLKFTIMIATLAIIISAVLFWTRAEEQIPNPRIQISQIETEQIQNIEYKDTVIIEFSENEKTKETGTSLTEKTELDNQIESDEVHETINKQQIEKKKSLKFNLDTIQPIDGSRFYIKADLELLEKLGFLLTNSGLYYYNIAPNSDSIIYNHRNFLTRRSTNYKQKTENDFFPIIETYMDGRIKSSRLVIDSIRGRKNSWSYEYTDKDFESINDTLLPLIIPAFSINEDPNDYILWFKTSDEMFKLIEYDSTLIEKFKFNIKSKRKNPNLNLVNFRLNPLITKTKFIELDDKTLRSLGIIRDEERDIHCYSQLTDTLVSKRIYFSIKFLTESLISDTIKYHYIPLATDRFGVIKFIEPEYSMENLIPVKVQVRDPQVQRQRENTEIVFWFKPTDYFFQSLPDSVSKELQEEYNYIIAENKDELEKPECKYFDECKNTLKINDFKIFPNPAYNNATVSFTLLEPIEGRITLVDLAGRERQVLQAQSHFSSGFHRFDLDVSDVPEGIYLITLYSDKGIQTKRFIVTR